MPPFTFKACRQPQPRGRSFDNEQTAEKYRIGYAVCVRRQGSAASRTPQLRQYVI
jgi:hypothetical protein